MSSSLASKLDYSLSAPAEVQGIFVVNMTINTHGDWAGLTEGKDAITEVEHMIDRWPQSPLTYTAAQTRINDDMLHIQMICPDRGNAELIKTKLDKLASDLLMISVNKGALR